jgi:hypothetical protein
MDKTLLIVAAGAAGAWALASTPTSATATPPPADNEAARAVAGAIGSTLCEQSIPYASTAGPLSIFGAQLHGLTAVYGRRVGYARGHHVYPDRMPIDCALAWGEQWRLAYIPWLAGTFKDGVTEHAGGVTIAVNRLSARLVALQRIAGRRLPQEEFLDASAGLVPLSKVFEAIGLSGDESAPLVAPAIWNLIDAIRQLAMEMESTYDAAVMTPGESYWAIFNDKLQTNLLDPAARVAAGVGGGALELLFASAAQLVLSPAGAAAAAFLAWRYLR